MTATEAPAAASCSPKLRPRSTTRSLMAKNPGVTAWAITCGPPRA